MAAKEKKLLKARNKSGMQVTKERKRCKDLFFSHLKRKTGFQKSFFRPLVMTAEEQITPYIENVQQ